MCKRLNRVIIIVTIMLFGACNDGAPNENVTVKEIYEWRIYTLNNNGAEPLDNFFSETLIPAYNRQGVTVGAFKLHKETDSVRYLLLVYKDIASYLNVKQEIWNDEVFKKAAQSFYDQTAPNPVYSEFESLLCEAFDKIPKMRTPDKDRTLFELRHYKSPNEEANQRKIKMFNADEIAVFDKVGINSVCYGEVLAGIRMPSIIYLTWYKDEPTRNAVWSEFVKHPDWLRIRDMKEYAYTATNNKNRLLSPLPYSQF
ncbi:MAG: NIPSNAP family protein [Prevotellaceae bacterium]|nr:NIPSNAP family protein [Prevotellaceae bacterium]